LHAKKKLLKAGKKSQAQALRNRANSLIFQHGMQCALAGKAAQRGENSARGGAIHVRS
jgi:hypothetical protein